MPAQSTADFYAEQQRITAGAITLIRREWAQMGNDFEGTWQQIAARVAAIIVTGQLAAVRAVVPYLETVLAETAQTAPAVGRIVPARFAGVTSSGRRVTTLTRSSVIAAKTSVARGAQSAQALAVGGRWLDMAAQTAIADTARTATAAAITARPRLTGYTRFVNQPSCTRCAVLAGKTFAWNAGFLRHPRCDCRHEPTTRRIYDTSTPANMAPAVTSPRLPGDALMPDHILRRTDDRDAAIRQLAAAGFLR